MNVAIELILTTSKSFRDESEFFKWYNSLNWQDFVEDNKEYLNNKFLFETIE